MTTNREQITAAARECNAFFNVIAFGRHDGTLFSTNELERFYSIAFEAGRSSEREDCAKVCDSREDMHRQNYGGYIGQQSKIIEAKCCAEAIRARSTK